MRFRYTAERSGGDTYSGVAEASDRFELYGIVRREGGRLVDMKEESRNGLLSMEYWNEKLTSVPEQQKILFSRNLGAMLEAGLPLSRALVVIERQTKNAKLRSTVQAIGTDIRRGEALNTSLSHFPKVFSKLVVALVKAGEEGGDLPSALKVASEQLERAHELKKKIKSAMLYPCIILVAIFGIGALMMIRVVPTLASTFAEMNATLPLSTRMIIALSDFLVQYTLIAGVLVVLFAGGVYAALRSPLGKRAFEWLLLRAPLLGTMAREVNAARIARTLASLLSSGIDVMSSLEITAEVVQNSYFRAVLLEARTSVQQGKALSATFLAHDKLVPSFVGEMMAVGEETGQTADMMKRMALYYEEEVNRKTKDLSTVIEPMLMVFIGAAVGFFAVSMITPIYQISQNI